MQEKEHIVELEFLSLSSVDDCNRGVKEVDVVDHERCSYRPDRFMRKIKW